MSIDTRCPNPPGGYSTLSPSNISYLHPYPYHPPYDKHGNMYLNVAIARD
jgi:hypothetical protein